RDNRDFDPAFSNVEDGIRGSPWAKTTWPFPYLEMVTPPSALARNASGSNLDFDFFAMAESPVRARVTGTLSQNGRRPILNQSCASNAPNYLQIISAPFG